MKGIILAGGLGTRLRPITNTGPKQLIPVANKPMIFYPIEDLVNAGIKEIAIIVGYTPERIDAMKSACGDGSRWGVRITYVEQDAPRGIAHAVWICKDFVKKDKFCVYLGDNLIKGGIAHLAKEFERSKADCSILLTKVKNPMQYGVAEVDDNGNVLDVEEKPRTPKSDNVITGIYMFSNKFFDIYPTIKPSWRGELEITDVIRRLVLDKDSKVKSDFVQGWWKDTGKSDDILHGNYLVLCDIKTKIDGQVSEDSKIIGNVIIGKGSEIRGKCTIKGPVIIGAHCTIGPNTYIGPYTSIGDRCTIEDSEIESSIVMDGSFINFGHKIVDSLFGKKVKLTKREKGGDPTGLKMTLGENSEVYE